MQEGEGVSPKWILFQRALMPSSCLFATIPPLTAPFTLSTAQFSFHFFPPNYAYFLPFLL